LNRTDEIDKKLEETSLDVMEYYSRDDRYRIRLEKADLKKHEEVLKWLIKRSYDNSQS
jgi:hypothetical protein